MALCLPGVPGQLTPTRGASVPRVKGFTMTDKDELIFLADYDGLLKMGKWTMFYGVRTTSMSRDDLLVLIGWLGREQERERKRHDIRMSEVLFGTHRR